MCWLRLPDRVSPAHRGAALLAAAEPVSISVSLPFVVGVRCGSLRQWSGTGWVAVALAMVWVGGLAGWVGGTLTLVWHWRNLPPRCWAVVVWPGVTQALWVDRQRIVFAAPYRVVYRDEVTAANFARLRRIGLGCES